EREVLAFVHQYGHLGYYFAAESCLARHSPELQELRKSKYTNGDPVSWIIAHAKAVQLVLQLREAFDDPVRLRQHLERLASEEDDVRDGNRQLFLGIAFVDRGRLHATHSQLYTASDADPKHSALRIFSEILNPNLKGTYRVVESAPGDNSWPNLLRKDRSTSEDETPVNRLEFDSLMDCIYWHLANSVTKGTVRKCAFAGCGHLFITTNLKRRYCPLPSGMRGESPCSNSDRQRNYRIARKQKAADASTEQ